jgi:hypothetical protein
MHGLLRVIVLGGLLVLAFRQFSPLAVAANTDTFPAALRIPVPALALLGLANPSAALVQALHAVCLTAWVLALIGLLTGPAMLITALTAMMLHGIGASMISAHGWIVPVATLACLAISNCGDSWSADAMIRRRWPAWPGAARAGTVGASGLGRKLVTLICIHTLFAGGVAKLLGGWGWADGESLQFYVQSWSDVYAQQPRWPWLHATLIEHAWTFPVMAALSLAMELSSPLALFSRSFRHALVVAAVLFHLGVSALMLPDFSAQALCYVLLIDWAAVGGAVWRRRVPLRPLATIVNRRSVLAAGAATVLAAVFLAVIAGGTDRWLLTNVPMYSSRVSPTEVAGAPRDDFASRDGLLRLAQRDHLPWVSKWLFWPRIDVVLTGEGDQTSIKSALADYRYRWVDVMDRLVRQQLPRVLLGRTRDEPGLDAAALLAAVVDRAAMDGVPTADYRTVQLVYRADDGPVVLAEETIRPLRPLRARELFSPPR